VVLRLRFDDFTRATRSRTLPWATSSTQPLLAAARQLVAAAAPAIAQRGLTLIGFAVSGIDRSGAQQLMLPFNEAESRPLAIDAAVDQVRQRFGKSALTRGVLVGRDPGPEMPHLPD
jgi:DNA polymerase-4